MCLGDEMTPGPVAGCAGNILRWVSLFYVFSEPGDIQSTLAAFLIGFSIPWAHF